MNCNWLLALIASCSIGLAAARADEVQVPSVLVKLLEEVEVPARAAGVLREVAVREGQMVAEDQDLARLEDIDARLDLRRAELELLAADRQAESDIKVRYARKSSEVAEAELRRALDSQRRMPQSVSQSELDQLRLVVQRTLLEIEEAELGVELAQAARALKQNELRLAEHTIDQRKITAPIAGMVVELYRHRGEWVEPGQSVARVLRLDRLRAEGLATAAQLNGELTGRSVRLTVGGADQSAQHFDGTVVFVSPEVDPVNGQVRIWAEIDNRELKLRPGLHGSMTILPAEEL